jgi:hypothetical protein
MNNLHPDVQKLIDGADDVIYRLTKIDGENNEDYPIGYWTIGYGLFLEKDSPCFMRRIASSQYMGTRFDYFRTSKVLSIVRGAEFDMICTQNSTYKLEQLNSVMSVLGKKIREAGVNED